MLKAANTALLALLAIACCNSEISSQEPPQTPQVEPQQQPEHSIKGQQEPTAQPNAAGAASPTIPNSHSPATSNEPQPNTQYGGEEGTEFWSPLFGHRLKITDTLLVAVTFLLFGATIALWWSTRRLVRGAEKTARDQLRAHVGTASSPNNFPSLNIGQRQSGNIMVTGYGQTPALKMRFWGDIIIREYPLATSLPIQPFRKTCRPINPKQTIVMAFITDHQLTAAEVQEIRAGTRCFYLYGVIEYFDIFGERRETTFRYWYGPFVAPQCWITCEEGNDQT